MIRIAAAVTLAFTAPTLAQSAQLFELHELQDREIAAWGRVELSATSTKADFQRCVPRESKAFSGEWDATLDEKIFERSALADLMKCDRSSCAFNFLPRELEALEKAKTEADRKRLYKAFYKDRYEYRTQLDPDRAQFLIRSKDRAFEICSSLEFDELLDQRPLSKLGMRLSHVQYNPRMRPTTRLVQGQLFDLKDGGTCYAEAFLYSDHYDLDRVEVWKWSPQRDNVIVDLQIRHRIDLLNTWFRRLNKGALRDELRQLTEEQLNQFNLCVASPR